MRWIERGIFAAVGAAVTTAIYSALGRVELGGDFLANVTGATIGGIIAVGLALFMFGHERAAAARDASEAAARDRSAAILEALRYVRAVREAVDAGRRITINNSVQITNGIAGTADLARRALEDVALTDFRLRLAMEEAANIGKQVSDTLAAQVHQAGLQDADQPLPTAADTCDPAVARLDTLIAEYTELRRLPPL